ncbi:peptide chain release factor N(5)-glutamine methyltransferase [Mongoliitalea daihaiensis]|uniref:peptide chain release factor N(5)-glutamine methyltransferase n=1 Tax=Mongoliitalea daihaiensis TaxID=2782006 RepID=UPI001F3C2F5F|nr:peptide chain release factor N(5)-glutamine methyltransferase [Mongoliitalea daihaiensis]UJP66031.1 peptide chain release factor N(5)-glutamine methyltransferase [Mongoliitalea daihaiensis]
MSIRELYQRYTNQLSTIYSSHEAGELSLWLMEHFLGIRRIDLLQNKKIGEIPLGMKQALEALMRQEPIQYILGKAPFYGREFRVSPAVLIPRNETEELVHLIIKENTIPNPSILDIGTGSGCIPISLALEIPEARVAALDISEEALEVAKENAKDLRANIDFYQTDILKDAIPVDNLDIIVSNPPYVKYSEKELMQPNVLEHEPHLALFVYDEDPLIFYREIAIKAKISLKTGGKLYLEINEGLGKETANLLATIGYQQVQIHQDLNGKDRMISATSNRNE